MTDFIGGFENGKDVENSKLSATYQKEEKTSATFELAIKAQDHSFGGLLPPQIFFLLCHHYHYLVFSLFHFVPVIICLRLLSQILNFILVRI